jgi:GNAT superfamily N-acetyltransferase
LRGERGRDTVRPVNATPLTVAAADVRSEGASSLIAALSRELSERYDLSDDGSGHFKPDDMLVPRAVFLIGTAAGRPVACGALRPMEEDVAEIKRMFVAPEWRRRGYSKTILGELERRAVKLGYRRVRLETGIRQPEAIGLYERSGYRRIPNFGIYAGSAVSVCFEKSLSGRPPAPAG